MKDTWIDKNKNFICASVTILLVSILSIYLSNKTLPSAEGWYSYFAKCINSGQIVYKDFEYLFTPVYMYMIAAFTKVFGYNLFSLRILGVVIFALIALILYMALSQVFSKEISVIAVVTGMFYLQSEVYTVFYDYVRIMDVFSYLAVLFMVLTIKSWKDNVKSKYIYLWAVFSCFFFLVKQNMGGLFLVFSCFITYSFEYW